jgi:hypothetical protein
VSTDSRDNDSPDAHETSAGGTSHDGSAAQVREKTTIHADFSSFQLSPIVRQSATKGQGRPAFQYDAQTQLQRLTHDLD